MEIFQARIRGFMDAARRDKSIGFLCLGVTACGWALNWPLMKLLLHYWPPLFARGLAGLAAALIFAAITCSRRQSLRVPGEAIPRLLLASFTNVFAWMGFGTVAMKFVTVGEGALIIYTMPIWAMLFAWPLLNQRPKIRNVIAVVLGVTGVSLLLQSNGYSFDSGKIAGDALSLSSAMLFALGTILNRRPLPMPPLVVVAWQVGLGCSAMLILGVWFEHPDYTAISPLGFACFVYMTLVPMGVCYLTWFETLRRLPQVSASTGMLLVPVLAIVAAAVILGEPLGLRELSAMALTLGGVTLSLQRA
jgi:drug/metabolite transporter (DMT)-like permease